MENKLRKVEEIAQKGYNLQFGEVFEKTFENFKKIWGIAGITLLLVSIVLVGLIVVIFGFIYGFSNYTETLTGLNPEFMTSSTLIGFVLFSTLFAGIFSPINAGFIKMAYLADTNQPFGINTVFDYFKSPYFKELFIASTTIALVGTGISYTLEFLGIKYVGNIITYIVTFYTILSIPLIIFSNLSAFESLRMSSLLVLKKPFILLALLFVSILFVILGIFAFCIGIIFTTPILFSLYYVIYKSIIPFDNSDEIDEIGINTF